MTNNEDSPEIQFKQLANWIFSKSPQDEKTICLSLAEQSQDQYLDNSRLTDVVLEFYVDLAIEGCKVLFGEQFVLSSLTEDQFNLVQRYMRSTGYKLVVKANDGNYTPWSLTEKGETVEKIRLSVVAI